MNADRLIKELERRKVVAPEVLKRLADRLARSPGDPSPRAVAKFLVDKGHLTVPQAKDALKAMLTPQESAVLESAHIPPESEPAAEDASLSDVGTSAGAASGVDLGSISTDEQGDVTADPPPEPRRSKSKQKKSKGKRQTEWDSPLILLGGGGLIMLLLVGGGILYLLFNESAEQTLTNARTAYENGSYDQAISDYTTFVNDFPNHEDYSLARVMLGAARIRKATDVGRDMEYALQVAQEETDVIEDQEAFKEAHAELNSLLPRIAEGLAAEADAAQTPEEMEKYIGLAEEALALCHNTKLIPGSRRDDGQLTAIREGLQRITRRQVALESLGATLEEMAAASAEGRPKEAYAAHRAFIKEHPELAENDQLVAAIAAAAKSERDLVRFVEEPQPGVTDPPASPVVAELAVANPRRQGQAPAEGAVAFRFGGGVYALSCRTGELLWRRSVGGAELELHPTPVDDDLLVVDAERQELVRVRAETGKLVWRAPLGEEVARPVVAGQRVLCAGRSGRLYVLDVGTGDRLGYVQFEQPLRCPPGVSDDGSRIYLAGEHSSLYTLSGDDLSCLAVHYLGHASGTVTAAPVVPFGRLIVAENYGADVSRLHVLGLDDQGVVAGQLMTHRLNGLVSAPPIAFGRQLAVVTDVGEAVVFEVSPEDDERPIDPIATRESTSRRRAARYAAVADGHLWLADVGLAKYAISPSGGRLPVRQIDEPFRGESFLHPLYVRDGALVHARKRRGQPGVAIAATNLQSGAVHWETDLAAPPAGAPVGSNNSGSVHYATADGKVYRVNMPAGGAAVVNGAMPTPGDAPLAVFEASPQATSGPVFWSHERGLAATPSRAGGVDHVALAGPIASDPTPLEDGWLVPLSIGQLHYVSAQSGEALAAPFQPVIQPGELKAWRPPATAGDMIVLADGEAVYSLQVVRQPPARLQLVSQIEAVRDDQVVGRMAGVGGVVVLVRRDDRLTAVRPDSLEVVAEQQLMAPVVWGPFAVGESVLLATADNQLLCVNTAALGEPVWRAEVSAHDLVGAPVASDRRVIVARRSGRLLSFDLATGQALEALDLGQRIASGPTLAAGSLLLAATDGALLVVGAP